MIAREMDLKPVVIGVAGGSGSGKTTVVGEIIRDFGHDQVTVIQHDSYYFDRRTVPVEERAGINYDHPDALETALFVEHIRALKDGKNADVPSYDFTNHRRNEETHHANTQPPVEVVSGSMQRSKCRRTGNGRR